MERLWSPGYKGNKKYVQILCGQASYKEIILKPVEMKGNVNTETV
jgi:hypothetical protein